MLLLWTRARRLVEAMLRFVERHRRFAEAMVLGAILAYLLGPVPWLGVFLALCALITAAAFGVMKELREDLKQLFTERWSKPSVNYAWRMACARSRSARRSA